MAGRLRVPWRAATSEEVEFRDGIHGLLVWGLSIILAALLAFATTKPAPGRADLTAPTASTAEPLLALELDRLFRTDRRPVDAGNDPELRAQAARILLAGIGRSGMSADDRSYLIRTVEARTGLSQPEAETRVNQAVAQAAEAIRQTRRGAVILAFMTGASLMVGAAVAWLMAALGGRHRDGAIASYFWRRWEVDRFFVVR